MMDNAKDDISALIGDRLRDLRARRGLSLDQLAELTGVSRAMISRIERAEASPTAALLARLCSPLGLSLSAFFEAAEALAEPLVRRSEQPTWRDPQSGYLRRVVGPPRTGSKVDIVEVEFPAGARVVFDTPPASRQQSQHVWMLDGKMELLVGQQVHRLMPGDCLHMKVGDVREFHNPTGKDARYAVIIDLSEH